jgi:hypothetical protein
MSLKPEKLEKLINVITKAKEQGLNRDDVIFIFEELSKEDKDILIVEIDKHFPVLTNN